MAMRAAASACKIGGRQRSPSLSSVALSLQQLKRHQFQPQIFISAPPLNQPGFKSSVRAISGAAADPLTPKKENDQEQTPQNWKIKMLYDGDCPLCMREVDMLRERNKRYSTIKFVDISSDDYSPEENQGLDYKTVMGNIHAILSDGTVVTDVEAFRKLYEQVGLGWVYAITKYEPIATIAGAVYGVWAKYRLQITGRPPLEEVLELRKKNKISCWTPGDMLRTLCTCDHWNLEQFIRPTLSLNQQSRYLEEKSEETVVHSLQTKMKVEDGLDKHSFPCDSSPKLSDLSSHISDTQLQHL